MNLETSPKLFMDKAKEVSEASIHITEKLPKLATKYVLVDYETRLEEGNNITISTKRLILFTNHAGDLGVAF